VTDPVRYMKSRSFVVLIWRGPNLHTAHTLFRWRQVEPLGGVKLVHQEMEIPVDIKDRDWIIGLLKKAGVTVRFYDPLERKWMDDSIQYGLVSVRGSRDGQWGAPTLEEFEDDYVQAV